MLIIKILRYHSTVYFLNSNFSQLKDFINESGPPHCPKLVLSSSGNPEYVIESGEGMQAKRISATAVQTHIFKYMHGEY